MSAALMAIFAAILPHLGEIAAEGEKLFGDVATGEGGAGKVAKAAADLAALSTSAATIAANAKQAGA